MKEEKLLIIFEIRNSLIELYPETDNSDKYILANELLNMLETLVRGE